jgi:hypothetical protein
MKKPSKRQIVAWANQGRERGHTHMFVISSPFGQPMYKPEYVRRGETPERVQEMYRGSSFRFHGGAIPLAADE